MTGTIVLWIFTALLAAGIFWTRLDARRTREKRVREIAALPPERREQLLKRLNPKLAMEIRQELMRRLL